MSRLIAHAVDEKTGLPHAHEVQETQSQVEEAPLPRNPITANHTIAWSTVVLVVIILVAGILIKNPFRFHEQKA
jgi:uncharacterized membrane protein YvbJ